MQAAAHGANTLGTQPLVVIVPNVESLPAQSLQDFILVLSEVQAPTQAGLTLCSAMQAASYSAAARFVL